MPGVTATTASTTPTPTSARTSRTRSASTRARFTQRDVPARLLLPRRKRRAQMMAGLEPHRTGSSSRKETITDYRSTSGTCCGCACSINRRASSASHRSTWSASCRSSRRRRRTRSWSRTSRTSSRSRTAPARTWSSRERDGNPEAVARARRRGDDAGFGTTVKNIRDQTAPDRQLDHDGRPHRDQPDRGGVLGGPGGRSDGASSSAWRSPSGGRSSRRWPRSAHRCATSVRSCGARPRSCSTASVVLAAGLGWLLSEDARGDAPARVRPAAGPPRGPVGVPRRPRRRRAGGGLIAAGAHDPRRCGACRSVPILREE